MLVAQTAQDLVANVTQLTSFSDVAFRIEEVLSDEKSGAVEIGALIETDPALSAALLRIANSAMYSRVGTTSIDKAVSLVGLNTVRDLAFGICAAGAFDGILNELISAEDFWKHSLHCAAAAQYLAKSASRASGSAFAGGLLHDIGQLVMFNQSPELSRQALQMSLDEDNGLLPYLAERKVFGFDHMAVGAELARQWSFPGVLCECIEFHHMPFAGENNSDATLVVHIANSIAVLAELDSEDADEAPGIDARAFTELKISPNVIPEAIAASQAVVADLLQLFVN